MAKYTLSGEPLSSQTDSRLDRGNSDAGLKNASRSHTIGQFRSDVIFPTLLTRERRLLIFTDF